MTRAPANPGVASQPNGRILRDLEDELATVYVADRTWTWSKRLGRVSEAREAYAHAIGVSEDMAVRDFLVNQASAVGRQ